MNNLDGSNLMGELGRGLSSLTNRLDTLSSCGRRGIYDIRRDINYLEANIHNVNRSINEIVCSLRQIQKFFNGTYRY